MTTFRTLIAASILGSLPFGVVFAQTGQAGTAASSLSTEKAPNTTVVGQTKPPSRDASPTSIKSIERLTPRQTADDAIATKVCVGCGSDPATTGALPKSSRPSAQTDPEKVQLNELRALTEPKKQSDLDTVALASAHRERAESMREKTNGLWQSWLVSVCDGCGDQKPVRPWGNYDRPLRGASLTTGSVDHKMSTGRARLKEATQVETRHHSSLEANLSSENIDAIRRMPQR